MSMLLTSDYKNLCLLSSSWHIKTLPQFIVSLALVAVLAAGYEYIRKRTRGTPRGKYRSAAKLSRLTVPGIELATNTGVARGWSQSLVYGLLVGYSYILMLIFMSYNTWVMLAVVTGAVVGHHVFQGEPKETMACH